MADQPNGPPASAAELVRLEQLFQSSRERARVTAELGMSLFKSLFIVNGGGLIAIVTLASGEGTGNLTMPVQASSAAIALVCYVGGLALAILAGASAWAGQNRLQWYEDGAAEALHDTLTHREECPAKDEDLKHGNALLGAAVAMALSSLALFVGGSLVAVLV